MLFLFILLRLSSSRKRASILANSKVGLMTNIWIKITLLYEQDHFRVLKKPKVILSSLQERVSICTPRFAYKVNLRMKTWTVIYSTFYVS